MHLDIHYVIDT